MWCRSGRFVTNRGAINAAGNRFSRKEVIFIDLPDTDDEGNEVTLLPDPWPDVAAEQVNTIFLPLVSQ